ncbi:MAG: outer membrane lipoprotein carrier protein LolA [Bacteroidia bacterium]|nr:outer membrane lipoprotein carrier protein LolA [Bacteroidia bacterium]
MKRYLFILFAFSFALSVFGQNMQKMTNIAEFEKQLKATAAKTQSLESNFKQEKYMKVFAEKVISSGMFYYRKENKISLQYAKPMKYSVTINGDKLQTVSDGKKTSVNLGSNKMMAQMKGLIEASMVGNISALSKDYELQYFQSSSEYFVKIIPANKSIKAYIKEIGITFDRQSLSVKRLRMTENNDDYTDYIFTNPKYNTLKSDEKFSVR